MNEIRFHRPLYGKRELTAQRNYCLYLSHIKNTETAIMAMPSPVASWSLRLMASMMCRMEEKNVAPNIIHIRIAVVFIVCMRMIVQEI